MLVACRLAGLSALEGHYADDNAGAQSDVRGPHLSRRTGRRRRRSPVAGSLQRGADLVEHGADLRADQLDGDDDEHRNKARDEVRILPPQPAKCQR